MTLNGSASLCALRSRAVTPWHLAQWTRKRASPVELDDGPKAKTDGDVTVAIMQAATRKRLACNTAPLPFVHPSRDLAEHE